MAGGQALEGQRRPAFNMDPDDLIIVGLDADSPRHLYDPRASLPLDEDFVEDIMAHGIMQNIVVAKIDGKVYVVAGRQRVKAAREANKRLKAIGKDGIMVPTLSPTKGDDDDLALLATRENSMRKADDAFAIGERATFLVNQGIEPKNVAKALRISVAQLTGALKLKEASKEVRQAAKDGTLAVSHAIELAALPKDEQAAALTDLASKVAAGQKLSTDLVRTEVRHRNGDDKKLTPTRHLLRKLVALKKKDETSFTGVYEDETFWQAIEWVLGDRQAVSIKGLATLINHVSDDK